MLHAELWQEYYGYGVAIYCGNILIKKVNCIQWRSQALNIIKYYLSTK